MPGVLRRALLAVLGAAVALIPASAAERRATVGAPDPAPVLADAPIVIDGRFDERTWELAPVIREFIQREPAEGLAPSYVTEARVAFETLFARCRDFELADPEIPLVDSLFVRGPRSLRLRFETV